MRLENSFQVPGSAEAAWNLLVDVPRVIPCMPGAELTDVVGENAWKATMHVKLGPISLQFITDITREEVDEAAMRVVLAAKGREARGRGGAQAKIESSLTETEGATSVAIVTDLTLQGAVAQYGRGVVADVSAQLTKQFAECLAKQLEAESQPMAEASSNGSPTASAPAAPVKPIGGIGLALGALGRAFVGLFRRRSSSSEA